MLKADPELTAIELKMIFDIIWENETLCMHAMDKRTNLQNPKERETYRSVESGEESHALLYIYDQQGAG